MKNIFSRSHTPVWECVCCVFCREGDFLYAKLWYAFPRVERGNELKGLVSQKCGGNKVEH